MDLEKVKRIVWVTQEDYNYIEELYRKLIHEYNKQAILLETNKASEKNDGPKLGDIISLLREQSAIGDEEIQKFAARFVK